MWRAASVARGDALVFADTDTVDFAPSLVTGVLGPLLSDPEIRLVKWSFERPFQAGGERLPAEGGRVTELVARPLINLRFPGLAGLEQPLAGELAIDRDLFERLQVPVGYGVEIAMLIDALREVGLDRMAQVDLGSRQNRHQPLRELSRMAHQVLIAVENRARPASQPSGRFIPQPRDLLETLSLEVSERPALLSLGSEGRVAVG